MARKKGRKKRGPSLHAALLAFFGAGALFLGSLLYLASLERSSPQQPFEEAAAAPSSLTRWIATVDQAIYRCLKKMDVPEEQVSFLGIQPMHANRNRWEFAAIQIRLPRQTLIALFERELKSALLDYRKEVRIQVEMGTAGGGVFHLYAGECYTHRITLVVDAPALEHSKRIPEIGILIDDLGYDFHVAEAFLSLDLPVSVAVLPKAPFTRKIVEASRQRNREILLHLPMESEAHSHLEAGLGALLTSMSERQLTSLLEEHLRRVPEAVGVNNHMGSRFTRSEPHMEILMGALKRRGLFYLDSRTTPETVAMEVAKRIGVAAAGRSVFLDNDLKREAMAAQLQRLLAVGRHSGQAVLIGHPHPETWRFLKDHAELLKGTAHPVPISRLVR